MYNALLKKKNSNKGFTLIELIVVIAILAILAVILVPRFVGFTDGAKVSRLASDCKTISKAVATYYAENGSWPTPAQLTPNYIPTLPKSGLTIDATTTSGGSIIIKKDVQTGLSAAANEGGVVAIVKGQDATYADTSATTEAAFSVGGVVYVSSLH